MPSHNSDNPYQQLLTQIPEPQNPREHQIIRTLLKDIQELEEISNGTPQQSILAQRTRHARRRIKQHRHPFHPPKLHSPENSITLGQTPETGRHYRVPLNQLTQHLLTTGESGSGKTTLKRHILHQLQKHHPEVNYWIFDVDPDYRNLTTQPAFQDQLIVLPWDKIQVNPLYPPPNTSPQRWIGEIADIFGETQNLISSRSLIIRALQHLWTDYTRNPDPEKTPTLEELQAHIPEIGGDSYAIQNYKGRVNDRLQTILSTTGQLFNCRRGIPLPQLLNRNVIIELDGMYNDARRLLVETLLYKMQLYRMNTPQETRPAGVNHRVRHATLIDEAVTVFHHTKESQEKKGEPRISILPKRVRKRGEALLTADQEPLKLTDSLLANTATKIILPSTDNRQFEKMMNSIGVTQGDPEWTWAQEHLDTGVALVYNRSTGLSPVEIPRFDLQQKIDNSELADRMSSEWRELRSHSVPE